MAQLYSHLKLQCHNIFKTESVKDWLLSLVHRKVSGEGEKEEGGLRESEREREQAVLAGP